MEIFFGILGFVIFTLLSIMVSGYFEIKRLQNHLTENWMLHMELEKLACYKLEYEKLMKENVERRQTKCSKVLGQSLNVRGNSA